MVREVPMDTGQHAEAWRLAHAALGKSAPTLPCDLGEAIPRHSEPWYCCAEPTGEQLAGF